MYDFICQTSSESMYLGDRLANIKSDVADMSNFLEVNVVETADMLNNKQSALVLPVLEPGNMDNHEMLGGKMPEKDAMSSGYAVLKDSKLAGYIPEPEARGYNFLTGNVHSSAFSVKG